MAKFFSNIDPCSRATQIIEALPASQRITDILIPHDNAQTSYSSTSTSPRCGLGPSFSSFPVKLSPIFPFHSHFSSPYQKRQMKWGNGTRLPLLLRGTKLLIVGLPGWQE